MYHDLNLYLKILSLDYFYKPKSQNMHFKSTPDAHINFFPPLL